ncbi:hypothetical protein [Pontibacter anaerobius]|uniref:PH domain-containing protein n=1 Tax=Pontibacter anaerobius TaxID=2993940 RepID=A0ABT3RJJ4_9BACT|nr:hypothetical protein [Pontibacter anaerobius]MCX2742022.1 hypothetical protein [Pontibacter anaerobius]
MKDIKLFALSESIAENEKWIALLIPYLEQADSVEFNTLYDPTNLNQELESLKSDLIEEGERSDKIYPSGIYRRYRLSERVRKFILSKPYKDWSNYQFEDLSLMKDGAEILATITHENYVFAQMTEEERKEFNEKGYEFGLLQEI